MTRVYIHGLGQTPVSWEKTLSSLNCIDQSICPDLAKLVQGEEVSYQSLYRAFSKRCNDAGEVIDLCGLSLGGVMALNYAIDHPEKINSLVLIAVQHKMPRKLLKLQNMLFRFMPKTMFDQTGFGKAEFIGLCKSMAELDFSSLLSRVSCPVLVVCGEKDNANKKASIELADILKTAQLQIVSGAGHEINIDAPEELAEMLREFYDSIS